MKDIKIEPNSITTSLVTYHSGKKDEKFLIKQKILRNSIEYLTKQNLIHQIAIVDNSKEPNFKWLSNISKKIIYHHNGENIGFGKGHNLCRKLLDYKKYHLIINPDLRFSDDEILKKFIIYLEKNKDIGLIQPLIRDYDSENIQTMCRRNPTFFAQIIRFFLRDFLKIFPLKQYNDWYLMKSEAYKNKPILSSYLSGCFMLCPREVLDKVDWFDKNYFMYLEDADLSRKISKICKCVHYPKLTVHHVWERDNRKRLPMIYHGVRSYIVYSLKWGFKII